MTDPHSAPPAALPRQGASRLMKVVLALSLALNLAVVGVVAGAALRSRGGRMAGPPSVRDLNFGPFSDALTREQRRDLRRGFLAQGPDLRALQTEMRGDLEAVLAALRAEPFDAAALTDAFVAQNRRISQRVEAGQKAMLSLLVAMPAAERAAFADRLEKALRHGGRRGGGLLGKDHSGD